MNPMATSRMNLNVRVVVGVAGAIAGISFISAPPSMAAGGGCANANAPIKSLSKSQATESLICLFNNLRSAPDVSKSSDLTQAAQGHSDTMRAEQCFSHDCPNEPGLKKRVQNAGYINSGDAVKLGEVIAYGPDSASPNKYVNHWKRSDDHRGIIKGSSYRDVGVGINIKNGTVLLTGVFGIR